MKKAVLELNKEAEDELADLVNIKVPEVNKHKKHDIIKQFKAFRISHRDAESDMYDISKIEQPTQQTVYRFNPVIEPSPIEQEESSSFQRFSLILNSADGEPPKQIVMNVENIEDYTRRLSRCSTLRKIQVKRENVRTKNAIIKQYQENEITYDEAVSKINAYKKK